VPLPELSDIGTQMQNPADGAPCSSRNASAVSDPHGRQTGNRHAPPYAGSLRPDGSLGSGGQAFACLVS